MLVGCELAKAVDWLEEVSVEALVASVLHDSVMVLRLSMNAALSPDLSVMLCERGGCVRAKRSKTGRCST